MYLIMQSINRLYYTKFLINSSKYSNNKKREIIYRCIWVYLMDFCREECFYSHLECNFQLKTKKNHFKYLDAYVEWTRKHGTASGSHCWVAQPAA